MASMNRRQFLQGTGAASAVGLAGCLGGQTGGDGETINVGLIETLTGAYAPPGRRRRWATEAAVEQVNEEGGLNGREIELHVRDTEADPGTATTKTQSLIENEDIELLCGTVSSGVCLAVGPIATRNQIPYSAGYCATRQLTGEECSEFAFRGTRNNAEIQWAGLGPYLRAQGHETISILYADYSWGQSERDYCQHYFANEGGGELVSEVAPPIGTEDFSQYIQRLDDSADVLVFILAGSDPINFLIDVGSFGIHEDYEALVTTGAGVGGFLEEAGVTEEVADTVMGINYYPKALSGPLDNEANRQFHEAYQEHAEEPVPTRASVPGWEAIWLFRDIAEEIDYTGPDQSAEFVDHWRGFEMEQSFQYPQGDKYYRGDNQCIGQQYIFDNDGYTEEVAEVVPVDVAAGTPVTCEL
jgi:branched-chain amino acid transport system substrate-binding protein